MQELHEKLVEVMDVFHAFCKDNGLTYYMLGGTMLGAYRHRGFIPWDDDIDIGMPRADYERLLAMQAEEFPQGYGIRHHRFEEGVPYAFLHFEDKNTTYIEQMRSKDTYVGGVFLEIFPLDDAPEKAWKRKWKARYVYFLKRIFYGLILDKGQKKRSFIKRMSILFIRTFFRMDRLTKRLDTCIRCTASGSGIYSNLLGHWGIREDIPREVFGTPTEYEFERRYYFGAEQPEKYLTALYGEDYMTPPSDAEKEASKHPAAYMNLQMPYNTYKNKK